LFATLIFYVVSVHSEYLQYRSGLFLTVRHRTDDRTRTLSYLHNPVSHLTALLADLQDMKISWEWCDSGLQWVIY